MALDKLLRTQPTQTQIICIYFAYRYGNKDLSTLTTNDDS